MEIDDFTEVVENNVTYYNYTSEQLAQKMFNPTFPSEKVKAEFLNIVADTLNSNTQNNRRDRRKACQDLITKLELRYGQYFNCLFGDVYAWRGRHNHFHAAIELEHNEVLIVFKVIIR